MSPRARAGLVMMLWLLTGLSAQAATLRRSITMTGPTVHLRDLFDDAGPNADVVLGPGPVPGQQIVIEVSQLRGIARMYGVDWQPVSAGDRSHIEWPGETLPRDTALAAVRQALMAIGVPADAEVELYNFAAPTIPFDVTPTARVGGLNYNRGTGFFSATLFVTASAFDVAPVRLNGRVEEMVEAPVLVTQLQRGTIVQPNEIKLARVPLIGPQAEMVRDPIQLVGKQLRRTLPAGKAIAVADLAVPPLVPVGSAVTVILEASNLSVRGQGVALDDGMAGDHIRVRIAGTTSSVDAEVIGAGQVRVTPGTVPRPVRSPRTVPYQER